MLSKEKNDLLTQTGPGTPCGELMRRYWQPVALAEELPLDGAPLPVRVLSEDLVLFRDPAGRPGLLGLYCSHRGTDLSYGRIEDGGLRCLYHGWLYDIHGACLEQPGEPAGSKFHERIRHTAYPCREAGGLILAYLGPGEPPLVPAYPILMAPDEHRAVTKVYRECNYLQANEGNIDSSHLWFLHQQQPRFRENPAYDIIETEPTNYGLRNYFVQTGAEENYVHITHFVMPNIMSILHWHVPIDDEHHWQYVLRFRSDQSHPETMTGALEIGNGPGYRPIRNRSNRYLQDREEMKTRTFAGLGRQFHPHDGFATESTGPIQDRTKEHLGYTDRAIIAARTMLLDAIADVQAGRDPVGVVRRPEDNVFDFSARSHNAPASADWKTYWKTLAAAPRPIVR